MAETLLALCKRQRADLADIVARLTKAVETGQAVITENPVGMPSRDITEEALTGATRMLSELDAWIRKYAQQVGNA